MVKDGKVQKLAPETEKLRDSILQLLCIDNLYKKETAEGYEKIEMKHEKNF